MNMYTDAKILHLVFPFEMLYFGIGDWNVTENVVFWHFYMNLVTYKSPMPEYNISKGKTKCCILASVCIFMQVTYLCHSSFVVFWQPSCMVFGSDQGTFIIISLRIAVMSITVVSISQTFLSGAFKLLPAWRSLVVQHHALQLMLLRVQPLPVPLSSQGI